MHLRSQGCVSLAGLFCDRLLLLGQGRAVCEGPVGNVVRAEVLREVYRDGFHVMRHPVTEGPVVLPMRRGRGRPAEKGGES